MNEYRLAGDPEILIAIRRTARARRLSLRVSGLDGRVTLTMPVSAPIGQAQSFIEQKQGWIRARVQAQPETVRVDLGAVLPVDGRQLAVVRGLRTMLQPQTGELCVSQRTQDVGAAVASVLKTLARDRLVAASDRHAAQLGRSYTRITLRYTRSRWGSCSSERALMYSWRLIMAPPAVLDYVAAHEVAHLAWMNHSARFWATCERLCPDYRTHRAWLKDNARDLHRYRFAD